MTTPPKRSDDERPAEDAHTPAHSTNSGTQKPASIAFRLRRPLVFLFIFAALFLFHLSLLNLPYYWDEAGYFIPAARDIYADGSFIPHSTLSNAHPPLVMAYLAIAWKLFGFRIEVARTAMLLVSAFALTGLFRLAERVANTRVAAATVVCAALYPVFFAQSSLAHLDMMVAALTMWGLFLYLPPTASRKIESGSIESDSTATRNEVGAGAGVFERRGVRRALCVAVFALAALAKETAALVPVALFGWEILCWAAGRNERLAALVCVERRRPLSSLVLLVALVPLASWFAYHRARTGYTFGNPEYFRYNVGSTLDLTRVAETLRRRFDQVTTYMNLWALTLAGIAAMLLKPRRDGEDERPRIAAPVQLLFAALVFAHVVALSFVGGAVLARYLLPVLPLVVLVWVSTLWRRVPLWPLVVALVCAAFVYRTEVNPPDAFPWEENLAYRDFILLHRDAAHFLETNYPQARVLTTWPATDELKNPYFGYLTRPLRVFPVEDFKRESLTKAAARKSDYDAALLFSTHGGPTLDEALQTLGGRVVFREERKGQWVAAVVFGSGG
ncbi:MAG TPA: glycosyltransferase family 39 protein [Pyrinomonadaceae bacterium]|nr:glycosyltransferase family 39 protein [Pyrinomonadaceae bacterium]